MNKYAEVAQVMAERFGKDTLLSLATLDAKRPAVRIVNSYYEDGAFYVVTQGRSGKMKQIKKNPEVAVCGDWFTAHGRGENIDHPRDEGNAALMAKVRAAFAEWYGNGDVNEDDPNFCVLRIRLTEGVLFNQGTKYEVDFARQKAR